MRSNRWEELSADELSVRLTALDGHEVGLVPVGATEQHGPHLPSGTDTIIATRLCELVAERTGCLVLPAISVACSFGHGRVLAGTLSSTPELVASTVREYADWAACSGLTRLLFVNAHFGNGAALSVATDHLRLHRPDLRAAYVDWYSATPEILAEVTADGDDIHANRAETSVMLALAPHLVDTTAMAGADDADRTEGLVFRYTAEALSTNGVTGNPSQASVALGEHLVGLAVTALGELVERGRVEEPPLVAHRPATVSPRPRPVAASSAAAKGPT
ncbi:MAG: creatininase family protein [Acidimicrobiales bacterium]|jgi:creatinine amidohydrolase|nr:creatininase family protein [Acidimicrobiales bacterium]